MGHYDEQYEVEATQRKTRIRKQVNAVRDSLMETVYLLNELPTSREVSLVKTKLDEARLWLGEVR